MVDGWERDLEREDRRNKAEVSNHSHVVGGKSFKYLVQYHILWAIFAVVHPSASLPDLRDLVEICSSANLSFGGENWSSDAGYKGKGMTFFQ